MVLLLLTFLLAGGVSSQEWEIPELLDPAYAPLDNTTIYTYTIKIYYTPEFEAITPDLVEYVEDLINMTNQGYINSNVSLRVKLHCLEKAIIEETTDDTMLDRFSVMKGTAAELRGSADAAALLVTKLQAYGVARGFPDSLMYGKTISVTRKDGAKKFFVFEHELGHTFGLDHNIEEQPKGEGHGYLIPKGKAKTGFNTIMAYAWTKGHRHSVNYYSNPDVILPEAGVATGVRGVSNSAAVLLKYRKFIANIGDESIACGDTINNCPTQPGMPIWDGSYSNSSSPDQCKQTCFADIDCDFWLFWRWKNSKRCSKFGIKIDLKGSPGYVSAPRTCSFAPKGIDSCPEQTGIPEVSRLLLEDNQTLENCKNSCKKDDRCLYWSLRLEDNKCYLTLIIYSSGPEISGARLCSPTDI